MATDTSRPLQGHIALVTGATGGIGKATCLSLARLGCDIAAHYHADADGAAALVEQLEEIGVKAASFQADLGVADEVSPVSLLFTRHRTWEFRVVDVALSDAGRCFQTTSDMYSDSQKPPDMIPTPLAKPTYIFSPSPNFPPPTSPPCPPTTS
ncbi:hypothetical protein FH972_025428 [Carpinus fangiana]|uniref:3-oxoacyl-[acyl-carrier-protein] reductase n=1 Tax=Carpinus fangiana TaxID=176857 RepID=A0A5N6L3K8_9ROSI|nr:hypothetical protein FH972_025428 [Carpinus fangiana]